MKFVTTMDSESLAHDGFCGRVTIEAEFYRGERIELYLEFKGEEIKPDQLDEFDRARLDFILDDWLVESIASANFIGDAYDYFE